MGLTEEQKIKREKATQGITTFEAVGKDDYVFISYKSDEWEVVLDKVVRYMVENYGLRVYFDKNFDRDNDSWVKNMKNAITTIKCRAVLAFVSKKYMVSYACLMELLAARSETTCMIYDEHKKLPIIPIIVDDSENVRDAMSKSAKEVEINEKKEYLELLEDAKKSPWVQDNKKLKFWLEKLAESQELTEERLSTVAELILGEGHQRHFTNNSLESDFFKNLKTTIGNCSGDVFAPGLVKKKTTAPAEPAADSSRKDEPETSADARKDSPGTNSVKAEKKEKTESVSLPRELYPELKIGALVQQVLKPLLEKKASEEEIRKMQEAEYSKEEFGITYPLLVESSQDFDKRRYYSEVIEIRGKQYHLCSQWFEVPANNDRPYVEKWIKEHQ